MKVKVAFVSFRKLSERWGHRSNYKDIFCTLPTRLNSTFQPTVKLKTCHLPILSGKYGMNVISPLEKMSGDKILWTPKANPTPPHGSSHI